MLGQSLVWASLALVPSAAAYSAQDRRTVRWVAGEDYAAMARRAEMLARTAAQQGFDADILLTRVVVTVLGENGGQAAPILKLDVGRNDWRNRPDPRYWSTYYRSTPALLGLEGVAPTGMLQAAPNSAPVSSPARPSDFPGAAPGVESSPTSGPTGPTSGAAPDAANGTANERLPASGSPPTINLPAVPAGVGIPAVLR